MKAKMPRGAMPASGRAACPAGGFYRAVSVPFLVRRRMDAGMDMR